MKTTRAIAVIAAVLFVAAACTQQKSPQANANELTKAEKEAGWQLLFDGVSTEGWRGLHRDDVPGCWGVVNGELVVNPEGAQSDDKGDIITIKKFGDFDLTWEWKMNQPGGNSGLKYYVLEELSTGRGGIGLEYQILDDINHEAVKSGQIKTNDYHTQAALYEIYETQGEKPLRPIGEWNSSRIISKNNHVEHWLNGVKVLEYERGSDDFRARVAKSKFKNIENFGEAKEGHILLQEHGGDVAFRNIKIKRF